MDNLLNMLAKLATSTRIYATKNQALLLSVGALGCMVVRRRLNTSPPGTGNDKPPSSSDKERKKSMLYTRTGDKGESSLYNGERRSKTDPVFEALGEQDELCAAIGIAREYCAIGRNNLSPMLIEIQSRLFDLGAAVATPRNTSSVDKIVYTAFNPKHTEQLELWIDTLDAEMPPLTTFIIPSGGLSSTHLHMARVVCRRAERAVVPLIADMQIDVEVGRYLNRLSDLLFAAARVAAQREQREEIEWRKAA